MQKGEEMIFNFIEIVKQNKIGFIIGLVSVLLFCLFFGIDESGTVKFYGFLFYSFIYCVIVYIFGMLIRKDGEQ